MTDEIEGIEQEDDDEDESCDDCGCYCDECRVSGECQQEYGCGECGCAK